MARVRARALACGMAADSRADLVEALFADGLSTRTEASEMSGRGVGLGALRQVVRELGGAVEVESEPGRGTTFRFSFEEQTTTALMLTGSLWFVLGAVDMHVLGGFEFDAVPLALDAAFHLSGAWLAVAAAAVAVAQRRPSALPMGSPA